jgi:2'-hydroxyisoflavone reductase
MQKRGHTPTLFNRGKTRPKLFPDVEKLRGDRDGDLTALKDRKWDAVIDTSGYVPRIVRASAELLAPNVRQYVFVSSISVYADTVTPASTRPTRSLTMPDPKTEEVMEFYGALKALCEQAAESRLPGRTTNIRPGLIVGPGDPTDRFTYWPVARRRRRRGARPRRPDRPDPDHRRPRPRRLHPHHPRARPRRRLQRDGPAEHPDVGPCSTACKAASGSDATLHLGRRQVPRGPAGRPVERHARVGPADRPTASASAPPAATKAIAHGLTYRPLDDTLRATLDWWATLPPERRAKLRAGITREREAAVLAAWHKEHAPPPPPPRPGRRAKPGTAAQPAPRLTGPCPAGMIPSIRPARPTRPRRDRPGQRAGTSSCKKCPACVRVTLACGNAATWRASTARGSGRARPTPAPSAR